MNENNFEGKPGTIEINGESPENKTMAEKLKLNKLNEELERLYGKKEKMDNEVSRQKSKGVKKPKYPKEYAKTESLIRKIKTQINQIKETDELGNKEPEEKILPESEEVVGEETIEEDEGEQPQETIDGETEEEKVYGEQAEMDEDMLSQLELWKENKYVLNDKEGMRCRVTGLGYDKNDKFFIVVKGTDENEQPSRLEYDEACEFYKMNVLIKNNRNKEEYLNSQEEKETSFGMKIKTEGDVEKMDLGQVVSEIEKVNKELEELVKNTNYEESDDYIILNNYKNNILSPRYIKLNKEKQGAEENIADKLAEALKETTDEETEPAAEEVETGKTYKLDDDEFKLIALLLEQEGKEKWTTALLRLNKIAENEPLKFLWTDYLVQKDEDRKSVKIILVENKKRVAAIDVNFNFEEKSISVDIEELEEETEPATKGILEKEPETNKEKPEIKHEESIEDIGKALKKWKKSETPLKTREDGEDNFYIIKFPDFEYVSLENDKEEQTIVSRENLYELNKEKWDREKIKETKEEEPVVKEGEKLETVEAETERLEVSQEVSEKLEKIDGRIKRAERNIEIIINRETETNEGAREENKVDTVEKTRSDTVEDELYNVRIKDMERNMARDELEKVKIQLQYFQNKETISEAEKAWIKELEKKKSEWKETGRELENEQIKLLGIWKGKIDDALGHLKFEAEEAEKKVGEEKKGLNDKLIPGFLDGKGSGEGAVETETAAAKTNRDGEKKEKKGLLKKYTDIARTNMMIHRVMFTDPNNIENKVEELLEKEYISEGVKAFLEMIKETLKEEGIENFRFDRYSLERLLEKHDRLLLENVIDKIETKRDRLKPSPNHEGVESPDTRPLRPIITSDETPITLTTKEKTEQNDEKAPLGEVLGELGENDKVILEIVTKNLIKNHGATEPLKDYSSELKNVGLLKILDKINKKDIKIGELATALEIKSKNNELEIGEIKHHDDELEVGIEKNAETEKIKKGIILDLWGSLEKEDKEWIKDKLKELGPDSSMLELRLSNLSFILAEYLNHEPELNKRLEEKIKKLKESHSSEELVIRNITIGNIKEVIDEEEN